MATRETSGAEREGPQGRSRRGPVPLWPRALVPSAIAAAVAAVVWSLGPIPQDPTYHAFADDRTLWGIPNFWNAFSSLPLLLAGAAGLLRSRGGGPAPMPQRRVFLGVLSAGVGSFWYHLEPGNGRLLWDRLAMVLAFAGFFSIVTQRTAGPAPGHRIALPLAILGCASVLYWYAGERLGAGDLRPYAVVQFAPLLIVPAMLVLYPATRGTRRWVAAALLCYVLAKVFEMGDAWVMSRTGWLSGHSLKHLWAALGALCVLVMLRRDRAAATPGDRPGPPPP